MQDIPVYSPSRACPKCGGTESSVTYCPDGKLLFGVPGELLRVQCLRCVYVRVERPLSWRDSSGHAAASHAAAPEETAEEERGEYAVQLSLFPNSLFSH